MSPLDVKEKNMKKGCKSLQTDLIGSLRTEKIRKKRKAIPIKGDVTCPLFFGRGSLTVEAALILPIFLAFSLVLLSYIDVMRIAIERQMEQQELLRSGALLPDITSVVATGKEGDCLLMDYYHPICLPFAGFGKKLVTVRIRGKVHLFNGYDDRMGDWIEKKESHVYITKKGRVYHRKRSCISLSVSVKEISGAKVSGERNLDGKKYGPCEDCSSDYNRADIKNRRVYLTDYGTRYHVSPGCFQLQRWVQAVHLNQAAGRTPCKFCY